jgi:hypothetical protein
VGNHRNVHTDNGSARAGKPPDRDHNGKKAILNPWIGRARLSKRRRDRTTSPTSMAFRSGRHISPATGSGGCQRNDDVGQLPIPNAMRTPKGDCSRTGRPGCDAWTLARIAGHSSIAISSRYVHPSEDAVLNAMANLGGHNSGHRPEIPKDQKSASAEVTEGKAGKWCARRDSNSRPIAPEAIALSI